MLKLLAGMHPAIELRDQYDQNGDCDDIDNGRRSELPAAESTGGVE
jgi:hypothetical protein